MSLSNSCESFKIVKEGCVLGGAGNYGAPKTGYIVVSRLRTQYKVLIKILFFDFENFSRSSPSTLIEGAALLVTP